MLVLKIKFGEWLYLAGIGRFRLERDTARWIKVIMDFRKEVRVVREKQMEGEQCA